MLIDPGVPLRGQLSFTDNVQLTGGDERAYTAAGKAQRSAGFQYIDVSFHPGDTPTQPAPGDTGSDETAGSRRPADR